ncbi:MAG TPA: hypothetical protein VG269_24845 [Tepidisphaeraceae bacterium]|jgi:ribosomal protein L37E|nr:hypothetical protein [Tepidisphaeraceae bacterium]
MLLANTMMLSIAGTGALLLVSLALLTLGFRGRRTDDHPVCRRCGFDLFGKPPESVRCSECGAELNRRRAVRLGNRRHRPMVVLLAMPLLLGAFSLLGTLRWVTIHRAQAIHYLPVWWLTNELNGSAGQNRDDALAELDRRLLLGKLSAAQVARIAGRALAIQADATLPWSVAWGDFVEHSQDRGVLAAELWRRYVRQTVTGGLTVRARRMLRRNEAFPVAVQLRPVRCGSTYDFQIGGSFTIHLGGGDSQNVTLHGTDGWWLPRGRFRYDVPLESSAWAGIANGVHPARMNIAATVTAVSKGLNPGAGGGMTFSLGPPPSPPAPPTPPVGVPLTADLPTVTVVDGGGPGVMLDTDSAHRAAIGGTIVAEFHPGAGCLLLEIHMPPPPVNVECDVLLRHGKTESKIGHISHSWMSGDTESLFAGNPTVPCDVVLRPTIAEDSQTVDTAEIFWGEPIVMSNVRLSNVPVRLR